MPGQRQTSSGGVSSRAIGVEFFQGAVGVRVIEPDVGGTAVNLSKIGDGELEIGVGENGPTLAFG